MLMPTTKLRFRMPKIVIEHTAAAWMWRMLFGPAMLLDGLLLTLTLGTLSVGTSLEVSRRLAMARIADIKTLR